MEPQLFLHWSIDLIGPLPVTQTGNRYIFAATDYFIKWPEAFPIPNKDAPTIAEALHRLFCRYGDGHILTDLGSEFNSKIRATFRYNPTCTLHDLSGNYADLLFVK